MNPLLLGTFLEAGSKLLDRLFPDPEKRREAEHELLKMTMDGDLKQTLAQLEVNAREAQHTSIFVAGWRPFVGWVGGAGFAYAVLLKPLLSWVALAYGLPVPPPIDTEALFYVLGGLLGLGTLRTVEKIKGATK